MKTFEEIREKCRNGIEIRSRKCGMTATDTVGAQFLAFHRATHNFNEKRGGIEARFLYFLERELSCDCISFNQELNEEIDAEGQGTEIEDFRAIQFSDETEKIFNFLNGKNGIVELAEKIKKTKRTAYRYLQHTIHHATQGDLFLNHGKGGAA